MLIKIIENDGTKTLLFKGSYNIAIDMINFFKNEIGLHASIVNHEDADWNKNEYDCKYNQTRADFFHDEYIKFGKKKIQLI